MGRNLKMGERQGNDVLLLVAVFQHVSCCLAGRPSVCLLPAKYQVSVQTASVHSSVLRVQHPAAQAGGEVGRRLSPLLGLWASVGGEEGEGGAGGDGIGAASVLLPQVLCDDAVEGGGRGQVALQLFLHGRSLINREERFNNQMLL